ncbi:DNA topoisomerase I [Candidatus Woesearchaeota archaeon CG10_big_fil_rev_8_21_14_0_10_44_13]|nr:MAG: DNA topoisomerase I [Candidatus Woesearchaeota archaeon CG10_big_fil_rev_8_21_14_0_10_44_13]
MAYELVITEKPQSAKKIADALADGKVTKDAVNAVPFYRINHKGHDIVVSSAVGHLYALAESEKKGWTYPVFNVEWKPASQVSKSAAFSSKYITALKKLSADAKEFTIATDYDIEGEVIGLNVIRYACKKKDAKRMKFSTLTKDELRKAYDNASKHLDWGQANAGETRHILDYYYGINLSRALSLSVKAAGSFKVLSSGRVQGPALKIIVDKEKEIKAFKPVPYWQIELHGKAKDRNILAIHEEDKFWEKKKADKVMEKTKGQKAFVKKIEKKIFKQLPPTPFDLTSMQMEAYKCLRLSPKDTLATAQNLYLAGLISYPRTSSQKLPPSIEYRKILQEISHQFYYKGFAERLLAKSELKPNEGAKSDPAHPSIYPTGQITEISGREAKLYDLIVRRFLSTFGDPAVREAVEISIDVNKEIFLARGVRTIERGWHEFYGPHVKLEEEEMPPVKEGEEVHVDKILMLDKETQPPRRYTPASIIKELEKRELGTKATRASIVDALYNRGYVIDKAIRATDLGIKTVETLEKYCPQILDEELTRHFEVEMEQIREEKKKGEKVLGEAKELLTKILKNFKTKEKEIGKGLLEAHIESRAKESYIGKCPNCEGTLEVRRGKFGRFIACNNYPECKTTFSLPAFGLVKSSNKECLQCKHALITIQRKGKRPQEICINPACPSKKVDEAKAKLEEKPCPKCKDTLGGTLVVRKSVYGSFLGCSKYPKCRHTEKLKEELLPKAPEGKAEDLSSEEVENKDPVGAEVEEEEASDGESFE